MAVPGDRIVIALDYGTTYTGIAFAVVRSNQQPNVNAITRDAISGGSIIDVVSWAKGGHPKVPSEIAYAPSAAYNAQWGYDIGAGVFKLCRTKLELEQQDRLEELDLILKALDGMKNLDIDHIVKSKGLPAYPTKTPTDIITDYLSMVREHIITEDLIPALGAVFERDPIDLVLTCPTIWSESAKNETFRAVTKAGFNNRYFKNLNKIVLVSEAEAAALFVLRSLQVEDGEEVVQVGDCFVHCDAGGGTVDVGAFRVKQTKPELILRETCIGLGSQCGSTFIDRALLGILSRKIGPGNFQQLIDESLETSIGGHNVIGAKQQVVMERLQAEKHRFNNAEDWESYITLPPEFSRLNIPEQDVEDGDVLFNSGDFREAFDPCVEKTVDLIAAQIGQIERLGSRVKLVSLSGGFASSDYLFAEINRFTKPRRISTRRPANHKEHSWPAVARGAVMHAAQRKTDHFVYMEACRRNYGVKTSQPFSSFSHSEGETYLDPFDSEKKAENQMTWLVRKGDLMLSNTPKYASLEICCKFGANYTGNFCTRLFANDDDEPPPGHLHNEMREAAKLVYHLSDIPESAFVSGRARGSRKHFFSVHLKLHLEITDSIKFWVTCNGQNVRAVTLAYA